CGAHRGEVNEKRNAREILQEHARHVERNLLRSLRARAPVCERTHVRLLDNFLVVVTQDGFEHDANRDGQARDRPDALTLQLRKRVELSGRPFFRRECLQCVEEIVCHLISQRVEAYQAKEPTPNVNGSVRPARPSKLARILSAGLHRAARSFAFEVLECKFKFKARVCATSSKWLSDRL